MLKGLWEREGEGALLVSAPIKYAYKGSPASLFPNKGTSSSPDRLEAPRVVKDSVKDLNILFSCLPATSQACTEQDTERGHLRNTHGRDVPLLGHPKVLCPIAQSLWGRDEGAAQAALKTLRETCPCNAPSSPPHSQ